MSAMTIDAPANAPVARSTTAAGRFATLLRREYWENRGGLMWAPIWASAIMFGLTLVTLAIGLWHASGAFNGDVHIGVPIKTLLAKIPPHEMTQATAAYDIFLGVYWTMLQVVLFFVVFFYLLGSLYDDRRDRSILFWKSLPVSDVETVLSKIVVAIAVAPFITWAIGVVLSIGVVILLSLFALAVDIDPVQYVWGPAEPLNFALRTLAIGATNVLWALPAVGWLMLVSAYSKSKPFLWALLLPIGVGVCISIFDVFQTIKVPETWYWTNIVGRALLSITPMSWGFADGVLQVLGRNTEGPPPVMQWDAIRAMFASLELWLGAVAGLALLAAATWFRRSREVAD
jgi:ABC-2 type transport system permease protein